MVSLLNNNFMVQQMEFLFALIVVNFVILNAHTQGLEITPRDATIKSFQDDNGIRMLRKYPSIPHEITDSDTRYAKKISDMTYEELENFIRKKSSPRHLSWNAPPRLPKNSDKYNHNNNNNARSANNLSSGKPISRSYRHESIADTSPDRYMVKRIFPLAVPNREFSKFILPKAPILAPITGPTCVNIPRNMSLCQGIGYHKMRLPNLLGHDTLFEVVDQSKSWVPLLSVRCHPDARIFLCSLYSPVCLDRPIFPCKSLCQAVKSGCEGPMKLYGFPWPEILSCDQFPLDNDLCISSHTVKTTNLVTTNPPNNAVTKVKQPNRIARRCEPCSTTSSYESILDNYCKSDIVIKIKNEGKNFVLHDHDSNSGTIRQLSSKPYPSFWSKNKRDSYNSHKWNINQQWFKSYHPNQQNLGHDHPINKTTLLSTRTRYLLLKNFTVKKMFKTGAFLDIEFRQPQTNLVYFPIRPLHHEQSFNGRLFEGMSNRRPPRLECSCEPPPNRIKKSHSPQVPGQRRGEQKLKKGPNRFYMLLGRQVGNRVVTTLLLPWDRSNPNFRKAIKKIKFLDCGQDVKRSI